jgi:hypothetical protein
MKLTTKDVKKLKEKGVDPSIILDLLLEDEEQDPGTTPENPKDEKPEEKKTETPDQKQEEKKTETPNQKNDIQDQILKAIEKLTGAVQTSNLLNAGSDGPDVDTTEAALASIINPKGGK